MFSSLSKTQRKIISSFMLLTFAFTTVYYINHPVDAENDPDQERMVIGIVTIIAGVYMAASEATDLNPGGVAVGAAIAGSGLYILMGGSSSSSSSGSNDISGGTSSMQPAPPETDAYGNTVYH